MTWSPHYCYSCANKTKLLLDGSCVDECPATGYTQTSSACIKQDEPTIQSQISSGSLDAIRMKSAGAIFAHFPCVILLLIPVALLSLWQETGRNSLTAYEMSMLNALALETAALFILALKLCIALGYVKSLQSDHGDDASVLAGLIATALFLVLVHVCAHLAANEFWYRSFHKLWDEQVANDFHEVLEPPSKRARLCCSGRLAMFRFGHVAEWIGFWKAAGWMMGDGDE